MASSHTVAARPAPARLRQARRQFLDAGQVAEGLVAPALQSSWLRSQGYGLAPQGRMPGAPHASAVQLSRALDQQHRLVSHAKPVMEFLSEQVRDTDSIVILADTRGMLLHTLGDAPFVDRAARVALRPGANWSEQWRGTNAIGTALADGTAVVVHGAEHYLERNAFLTCTAAPILDPAGQLLGVLDISGDHRSYHRHTLGLVRAAARMIEHQLFDSRHAAGLQLRLHRQPEGIGTVTEGRVALSEDGRIVGANAVALELLGLRISAIGQAMIEQVLGLDWTVGLSTAGDVRRLQRACLVQGGSAGHLLWVRIDGMHRSVVSAGGRSEPTAPASADALTALDTGDGAMQAAIGRARRVQGKPIALLLQGESGVGKEVFARACHDSGLRAGQPFVAVNCAALPESLIEAELFGYAAGAFTGAARDGAPGRIREAHGGTLFLDEIGDMPLPMQTRLLRVLQERQVTPLGGGKLQAVDFQLICASHRRLTDEVAAGRFREDLYYRINGLALRLPPLRERSDLPLLIQRLLRDIDAARSHRLAPEVADAFARYRWPGNLRQLHSVLRTACALLGDDGTDIGWQHLPDDMAEELCTAPRPREIDDPDTDLRLHAQRCVEQAVSSSQGNLSEAARRLGISRNTLYRKLRGVSSG